MTDNVQVATIFASSYADVAKKASASKIGVSLTMLALGVLSFVSYRSFPVVLEIKTDGLRTYR